MDQFTTQTIHQLPSDSAIIKREICCTICFVFILISSIVAVNLGSSSKSLPLFRFDHFFLRKPAIFHHRPPLRPCDYSYSQWIPIDHNYPVQLYDENCPFLGPGFRCRRNGRKNFDFLKWRWQPHDCYAPRYESLIIFTVNGDSVGRNQWESLLCMLTLAVSNKSAIFEQNGSPITKHKGFLSMKFQDYNLTVEYYGTPFIAQWKGADVIVFNTGHWWNKEKIAKMGCYFQEGGTVNMKMDAMEAFTRKDGHPSKYREPGTSPVAPQDCSHWCLPGAPDTWNQLLYAQLLSMEFRTK
ncbi:hypothetical protein F3Y22_tig00116982pilonHSYRG00069 [Hibiscus syriacus]|uniref:Uncharacterized protein n=1 Tax=Hibiscus syriacus TaxID=106335 RepID=A0A6A2XMZ2_HIBSY|nr:hypothetical protein F3Y22_tig00116982pilonHSYRG00069 [Hibiscus syriacus]